MSTPVTVQQVASSGDLRAFIELAADIYRGTPQWVRPLDLTMRHTLDFRRNPFWQHAEGALFLAQRGTATIGRISAHIDHNHIARWNDGIGFFGFFESINDPAVATALCAAAADWLRNRGMQRIRGPFSPSINGECGFLMQGFDRPPVIGMAYSPPYYLELAALCGFSVIKRLWAYEKATDTPSSRVLSDIATRLRRNPRISVRPFDMRHIERDSRIVTDIFNECWADNWSFAALSHQEMFDNVNAAKSFADMLVSRFACYDGVPIGFCLVLPDLNEIIAHFNGRLGLVNILRTLVLKRRVEGCRNVILGVRPGHRFRGVPALLYNELEPFVRRHYTRIELSWVLDENADVHDIVRLIGATQYKHFGIMERAL